MSLPAPNLDDRRFQDLVDEAKRMVQQRCPEWTDHNVSDPGVTLIETFAFMVDQLLYRLNRVPDRLYIKLLELIDVRRFPPTAATADVTFWLSAPQPEPVVIELGTEVATQRTEFEDPVTFTVVEKLTIHPSSLHAVATRAAGAQAARDVTSRLRTGAGFHCFAEPPAVGDEMLVGLTHAVPRGRVLLHIACTIAGVGVDPRNPPIAWEAWTGTEWIACDIEKDETGAVKDETGGLNQEGDIVLHVPRGHVSSSIGGITAAWLRCRVVPSAPGQRTYHESPRVEGIVAGTVGGTTEAVNADVIDGEMIGVSEGVPGQRFKLQHAPVVPSEKAHVLKVGDEDWEPVETFASSSETSKHFIIDEAAGELAFGPAVREPDGKLRHYGAVPPARETIRIESYRAGGGAEGNVASGAISVLKGAIPLVSRVVNRHAASGGVEGEDLEAVKVRGPLVLRKNDRAVTATDYETMIHEVAPEIARVRCVPAGDPATAGLVTILVVPAVDDDGRGHVDIDELVPLEDTLERIRDHLDARRPVGTQVFIKPPTYQAVTIAARLTARRGHGADTVKNAALDALFRYYHPVTGGPDGTGWPFGRPVHLGEIHGVLQGVLGIELVQDVRLFPADPVSGRRGDPVHRLDLDPLTLAFSYEHRVLVERS